MRPVLNMVEESPVPLPLGLVLSWLLGQCRAGGWLRLRSRSTRETASKLVAALLLLFHLLHVAQFAVYCTAKYKSMEVGSNCGVEISDFSEF
jgi:hypothetical protein